MEVDTRSSVASIWACDTAANMYISLASLPPYLSFSLEALPDTGPSRQFQRMCPSVIFVSLFPFQVVCFELPGRAGHPE